MYFVKVVNNIFVVNAVRRYIIKLKGQNIYYIILLMKI